MAFGTLFFDAFTGLGLFRFTGVASAAGYLEGRATDAGLTCGRAFLVEGKTAGSFSALRAAHPSPAPTTVTIRAYASHMIADERFIDVPCAALPSSVAGRDA